MIIQLYKDGKEIIASDGQLWVDGRLSDNSVREKVRQVNKSREKNFAHKIADSFAFKLGRGTFGMIHYL